MLIKTIMKLKVKNLENIRRKTVLKSVHLAIENCLQIVIILIINVIQKMDLQIGVKNV